MKVLLLDMDGPLADLDLHFWNQVQKQVPLDIKSLSEQRHRYLSDHVLAPHRRASRRLVETPGWFRALPVTEGAQEGVQALLESFDVWVCSKPLNASPTCCDEKRAWLAEHFPDLRSKLILASDKSMICGDYLLDDAPKLHWIDSATWEPIIFTRPFNSRPESELAFLTHFAWGADLKEVLNGHHENWTNSDLF